METPWFSKSWRDAPETPLSKAVYSLNGSEMSFHGGGYTTVFFGGARIERSHDLFTLKNGVFHFKMHFFTQNALLSAYGENASLQKNGLQTLM